jgi:hypothetical protein
LYFNEYYINTEKAKRFKVLNAYGMVNDKSIFEITCRYTENIEASASLIFFSILSNSFYDEQRFLNPLDEIKSTSTN